MFSRIRTLILDLLFPPTCLRCGKEGCWLCPACTYSLPRELHQGIAWSLLRYDEPWVAKAVHEVKYSGASEVARTFGALLADRWKPALVAGEDSAVVTAIPLHARRERERGFNQSEHVARAFAQRIGLPYVPLLERQKMTLPQATLDHDERQRNIVGAFRFRPLDARTNLVLSLKTVILIDDVVTTGATLREASSILLHSGVTNVILLTVAYAPLQKGHPGP
ncbi:MAG: ComF family protein [bacterium]